MAKRLYVGGLDYATTESELEKLFAQSGTVTSTNIVCDRYTGQSKGFGFVDMADDAEAEQAIQTNNGNTLAGRTIVVNEARPREERPRNGGQSW